MPLMPTHGLIPGMNFMVLMGRFTTRREISERSVRADESFVAVILFDRPHSSVEVCAEAEAVAEAEVAPALAQPYDH